MTEASSLRHAAALLLILATVAFVTGIAAERSLAGEASETPTRFAAATTDVSSEPEAGAETGESHNEASEAAESEGAPAGATEGQTATEAMEGRGEEASESHVETSGETLFGVNPESTGAITAVVIISLLLAGALWLWQAPILLVVVAVFALLFAAFDLREVAHQFGEARGGLVLLALLIALLHLAVAIIAALALARAVAPPRTSPAA